MDGATLLLVAATALLNAGFAWLMGSLLIRGWLVDSLVLFLGNLRRAEGAAALCCLLGGAGVLLGAAARMGDSGLLDAVPMWWPVTVGTDFGRATALAVAAALLAAWCMRRRALRVLAGIGLLLFGLSRASVSHGAEGGLLSAGFAVEVVHLLLIALWLGGVALAAWVVLPAVHGHAAARSRYLGQLSLTATMALAGIVATGAWNSWHSLAAPSDLWQHPYGILLAVKLVLFALAAVLGGWNRFVGFPRATSGAPDAALRVLRIESIVLLAALIGAAALVAQQAPA